MEPDLTRITIGDGAVGTQLQKLSGKTIFLPESLNLTDAGLDLLRRVHDEYIQAGAQIIETNTFAGNFPRLERFGLGAEIERINSNAVEAARKTAAGRVLVAGSVGPLDLGLAVKNDAQHVFEGYFRTQMSVLKNSGVDLLLLETFYSPFEARLALAAAAKTGLPVFFLIGGQAVARPYARKAVQEMAAMANEFNVTAFGINCVNPHDLGQVLNMAAELTDLPLLAYPNAGTPVVERGLVKYELAESLLIAEADKWLKKGVAVFGGCCGTAPEHIRALSSAFKHKTPVVRSSSGIITVAGTARTRPDAKHVIVPNPVRDKLNCAERPLIAVEIKPSLARPLSATVAMAGALAECGIDFFDVPDNPAASPGRDCMACASMLQQKYKIPVIMHKAATQANALSISSYLLGAYDLGIRGVLAITGDSPGAGTFDRIASRVNDVRNSIELLRLLELLREGMLVNGQSLPRPVDFAAGCAFAHGGKIEQQISWLSRKVEAGAEFVFTQPVFSGDDFQKTAAALQNISVKIFIGVLPLTSARQARAMQAGKIPGITVPEALVNEIGSYPRPEDQLKAGMDQTMSLIGEIQKQTEGIYLIMPFHKNAFELTVELLNPVKSEKNAAHT
jgi:homocysteine S-methyltransferase